MLPVLGHFRPWTDPTITAIGRLPMHVPIPRPRSPLARRRVVVRVVRPSRRRARAAITGDRPDRRTVTVPGNWTMQDTGDHPALHQRADAVPRPAARRCPSATPPASTARTFTTCRGRGSGTADRAARRRRRERARRVPQRRVRRLRHRQPAAQRVRHHRAASSSAANDLAIVVVRYSAQQLRRGPGPVVDGRPAPQRARRVATAGAHRRRALRRRLRPGRRAPDSVHGHAPTVAFVDDRAGRLDGAHHAAQTRRVVASASRRSAPVPHAVRRAVRVPRPRRRRHVGRCRRCAPWSAEAPEPATGSTSSWSTPTGSVVEATTQLVGFRHVEVATAAARQRPADLDLRRQPPRPPPRPRQGGDRRRHARRPAGDAAPQHHRRAHVALPERLRVLRPVRRARHVRDRRGEHREPRLQHQLCHDARYRPACRRARRAHGAARPQPPVDHPVEPRQRERLRRQPRRARRVDPPGRPEPAAALRGRVMHGDGTHRRGWNWVDGGLAASDIVCPMYPPIEAIRQYGADGVGHAAADPVRVQPRDGQLQRLARRLLGGHHHHARAAGRVHLGVEGPRPPSGAARRHACASPTAASSATRPTTATSSPTGWCRPTSSRTRRCARWPGCTARSPSRARPAASGTLRDHQPPVVHRPRRAARDVGAARRRRGRHAAAGCALPEGGTARGRSTCRCRARCPPAAARCT